MSNRFVSGGTINASDEPSQDAETTPNEGSKQASDRARNPEWEAVQKELESERQKREAARLKAVQGEEKSLYDILQANKAAKQAAFEEQNRIKNQFRALDDDEIDFLDEVRESQRKEEDARRRETEEGLKAFREKRQAGAGAGATESREAEAEAWAAAGRKRKRLKEKGGEVKGLRRKTSGTEKDEREDEKKADGDGDEGATKRTPTDAEAEKGNEPKPSEVKKSLVAYGSDSDEA